MFREIWDDFLSRQEDWQLRVVQHKSRPLAGIAWVERHIRAPGF